MNSILRFVLCVSAAGLAGCYTIKSHETTHPITVTPCRTGPGGAEGELFDGVGLKRTEYSGERVTVGLFPGHPFFLEEVGIGTVGGTLLFAIWVPVGNLFLALPTVCTLLVEPFVQADPDRRVQDGDIMSVGLAGAFRWKVLSSVETEEEYRQRVLLDGGYSADLARIPAGTSSDGTRVYFEYPGFRVLRKTVKESGGADVVFSDGSQVRRFVQSDNDENLLTCEDRGIDAEPAVGAQFASVCEWKSILAQTKRLRYAKGYGTADDSLKARISSFESEVERVARSADARIRADPGAARERLRVFDRELGQE